MLPKARIMHQSPGRIRLRFLSQRRDSAFFDRFAQSAGDHLTAARVEINPATGSVLLCGPALELEEVVRFGLAHDLFRLEEALPPGQSLALEVGRPLRGASRKIGQLSGGRLDLPGLLFVALLIYGLLELIRGNWKSPPWYTAFWYAFGLFSRSVFDQQVE